MKRKLLSALLAFCMVLTILPGTAMAANYWQNLSRSEAAQVANSMLNRTAKEDLVLIYTHSSASTAAYANYAEENQIKVSCYSGSESFNEMFSLLKDYEWGTSVSFPMIAAYNGVTRSYETITGQGNMAAFEALLDKVGIPSDSGAASSQPLYSSNAGAQNYLGYAGQWAQPVKSHLYENAVGGVTRVEYYGDTVIVEDYDSSYRFLSRKEIPLELPIWGGFFAGENANFLIFGKENPSQSDSAEVIRVVKYSKDWQRQGSYSLNGANTTVPFDAGSVRCTELNGDLYVRTCHEMYTSKDGKNHQSNMTVVVRESDMSLKEAHYAVISGRPDNYTSHSFNQFILTDNSGKVVMVDHGDAYSRAIVIAQYGGGSSNILDIPGATGANATGASVGGLAETSSGYVTAYTYDGVGTGTNSSPRNIYLAYTSKDGLKNSTPVSVTTTKARYSNPVLAPTGLNGGYLLWNDANGTLCYTTYSVDGSVGNTQTASGLLSDCQPISHDGKMVWYTTNNSAPVFYTLDSSGVKAINPATAEKATPVVQANDITVTVGETLPEITGTATFNGSSVPGTWNFVGEAPSTAEAKVFENVNVKFVPNDKDTYNEAKTTINVTINAAPVEKVTPVVEANDITATLGDTLTITGTAKDGEKDVAGTWKFVDVAPNTVGTHSDVKVEFIPDDTDAYNKAEDTITVTINAAPVEKVTPVVEANDITATLGDTLTITGTAKDGEKDVSGTWSFVDAAPNTAGTHENVKVKFTPDNTAAYNEVETSITVTINAAPVEKVTPVVEANDITATLGDTLTITGTAKDGEKDVSGTWSFVDAAPNTAGTHENVKVKFTPDNTTAYNEVETSITVTINAAPVEKVTPIVSANDITVTLGNALTITGTAKDGDKTVSGTWSFVDAAPNTVGTHENVKVRFTPTNTAAYNVAETTITVTINAAPVDPTTPIVTVDDISVPYGVTVKDSDIRGTSNVPGVWSFVGTVPTAVGSHRVTVRFTPNDTAAYKSVDRVITLRIYAVDHGDITDWVNFPHNDVIGRPVSNLVAEVVDWIFNQYGVRFAAADFNVYVNEYSVNLASIVRNDTRYVLHFNGNAADNAEFERLFNSRRTLTFGVERESGEEYYIALDKMENGQVIANTRYAESGARVTLSVHPDSGYELDTLEVTDVRGRTVTLRDLEDGRYSFTMPSNRVTVEATFKAVKEERPSLPGPDHTAQNPHDEIFTGLGTPGISGIVLNPAAMPFTDVHGPDWFYNHVEYMWKHYLMSGTTENRFDPNLTTSRAMIWTIMARMNNVRTDINPGSTWYEKGMLWAMERGITDGSNAMGDITREQLATMLWRNAGSPIAGGDLSRFSDADSVSAYALNAVRWAASNGILSGINGRIEPQGTATRAQVAAMVARYGDKVVR